MPASEETLLSQHHTRGVVMLVLATIAWGSSFALTRSVLLSLERLLPDNTSWTHASLLLAERFALAALALCLWQNRRLRQMTASEVWQGIGLGLLASMGSLLQTDGLRYTEASTSAFLTQFTCVLVPLVIALQRRKLPSLRVMVSCATVLTGVAVLSGFSWRDFRLGRGEAETLLCAVFFTGQILCLEVTRFRSNNPTRVTLLMSATVAAVLTPVAATRLQHASAFLVPLTTPSVLAILLVLVFVCTLFSFGVMNRWQPHVGATKAGLIYCAEPLSASLFALFLPAWISLHTGIAYGNEQPSSALLFGGALITVGNVLILLPSRSRQKIKPSGVPA